MGKTEAVLFEVLMTNIPFRSSKPSSLEILADYSRNCPAQGWKVE